MLARFLKSAAWAVGGHAATEEVAYVVRGDQEGPTLTPLVFRALGFT